CTMAPTPPLARRTRSLVRSNLVAARACPVVPTPILAARTPPGGPHTSSGCPHVLCGPQTSSGWDAPASAGSLRLMTHGGKQVLVQRSILRPGGAETVRVRGAHLNRPLVLGDADVGGTVQHRLHGIQPGRPVRLEIEALARITGGHGGLPKDHHLRHLG